MTLCDCVCVCVHLCADQFSILRYLGYDVVCDDGPNGKIVVLGNGSQMKRVRRVCSQLITKNENLINLINVILGCVFSLSTQ